MSNLDAIAADLQITPETLPPFLSLAFIAAITGAPNVRTSRIAKLLDDASYEGTIDSFN